MPSSSPKLGLSLSGGGYRATAFHLGTLKKLQEMNILHQVEIMSTISGGSITGAYYCLHLNDFASFEKTLYEGLNKKNVITRVLLSVTFLQLIIFLAIFLVPAFYFLFAGPAWLFPILFILMLVFLMRFQFSIFPVSKRIEKIYDQYFFSKSTLNDLPAKPLLVIGSTNMQTGRPFTFSKTWMQDSTYQFRKPPVKFKAAEFPVSRAVMASSCVPFAFTPVRIDKKFFVNEEQASEVHPLLVDGGVYDNQGIHKIVQQGKYDCSHIITSDAGGGSTGEMKFNNVLTLLIATVDVFMLRIKNAQMTQDVFENADTVKKEVAYFSLAWDAENCIPGFIDNLKRKQITSAVIAAHKLPANWVEDPEQYREEIRQYLEKTTGYASIQKPTAEEKQIARTVGTNLTSLSRKKIDCLIKQAECLTELQVKLYCPTLIHHHESAQ